MWAQWDRRLTKCTQTESPAHVGPRRLGRAQPLGSMVRALGISCPPGGARPAPDETGLWWSAALALRSVRSWCHEPVYKLDPEPPAHPALSPGLRAGARILEFDPPGLLAGAVRNGRRS